MRRLMHLGACVPMDRGMTNKRISLGVKLAGLAGALCVLMLGVVVVAVSNLSAVADRGQDAYRNQTLAIDALSVARGTHNLNRALTFKHMVEPSPAEMDKLVETIHENDKLILSQLKKIGYSFHTPQGRAEHAKLIADFNTYVPERDKQYVLSRRSDKAGAYAMASQKVTALGTAVTEGFDALQKRKLRNAKEANADARHTFESARTLVLGLLGFAIVLGAGLAFFITRGIRRGVREILARLTSMKERDTAQLEHGLRRFSEGDLTVAVAPETAPIPSWSNDELGDVARAVNAVTENTHASMSAYNTSREALAGMIGRMAGTASTVSSASQQMASTSEETGRAVGEIASAMGEVAMGSQRQVEGIDEARRLTDEVVQATTRSAEEAARTATAAEEARRIASEGASAVTEATEAMVSVRTASAQATEAIRELGGKSAQIGSIVDTITGISEQTNLLALNAAIEAARAGEQGRGFAVVAEEVRKLAEESSKAASSIAELIAEIQAETGRAVQVVEDGSARTEQGAATVEQAREAFQRIDGSVEDVTARVGQIAAAVQQIAASAAQTGQRIGEIAAVAEEASASTEQVSASTEQTSASTQEIAASAQELARSSADLEELVARFTVA